LPEDHGTASPALPLGQGNAQAGNARGSAATRTSAHAAAREVPIDPIIRRLLARGARSYPLSDENPPAAFPHLRLVHRKSSAASRQLQDTDNRMMFASAPLAGLHSMPPLRVSSISPPRASQPPVAASTQLHPIRARLIELPTPAMHARLPNTTESAAVQSSAAVHSSAACGAPLLAQQLPSASSTHQSIADAQRAAGVTQPIADDVTRSLLGSPENHHASTVTTAGGEGQAATVDTASRPPAAQARPAADSAERSRSVYQSGGRVHTSTATVDVASDGSGTASNQHVERETDRSASTVRATRDPTGNILPPQVHILSICHEPCRYVLRSVTVSDRT
jgi:hypothetical protein